MKTLRNMLLGAVALCGAAALPSCSDEGCIESTISYAVASVKAGEESAGVKPKWVEVRALGYKDDTLMVDATTSLTGLSLLLNPDTTSTRLEFTFRINEADDVVDTIDIHHTNRLYFLTIDCGCGVFSDIDTVLHTSHYINSIAIINPEVTNEKKPNLELYY